MTVHWPTVLPPAYVVLLKKPHSGQNLFVRKPPAICDPHSTDLLDRHRRLAALVDALGLRGLDPDPLPQGFVVLFTSVPELSSTADRTTARATCSGVQ